MQLTKKQKYIGFVAIAIIVIAGLAYMFDAKDTGRGGMPLGILKLDLSSNNLNDAAEAKLQEQFDTQAQRLAELTPDDIEWVDVIVQIGIIKFSAEDYQGAKEAWEYAYDLRPGSYTINGNLANLYFYYLKDYKKAEQFYLDALDINPIAPGNEFTYFSELLDLYQYGIEDDAKARALIDRMLEGASDSAFNNVKARGAEYYRAVGNEPKAEAVLDFQRDFVPDIQVVPDFVPIEE